MNNPDDKFKVVYFQDFRDRIHSTWPTQKRATMQSDIENAKAKLNKTNLFYRVEPIEENQNPE